MPLARLAGISGYLNDQQKKQLIEKVTDAILSIEGEGLRPVTWVLIEDVPEGQWGVGGEVATAQLLRDMRDGKAA
jgi:4-oxalocrotonate tautomerase